MNFLTTIFESISKLTGFVTEAYKKEMKLIPVKIESKSYKTKFNR